MKIVVDGVFFQLASTGIYRVWASILPLMARFPDTEIVLLDRGKSPPLPGIRKIEFPRYTWNSTAADSRLLEMFCEDAGADVFVSTYYTTPLTVPSALIIHDMIPEVFKFDFSGRGWMEKEVAIAYASRFICVSENTRSDLLKFYPDIPAERIAVAHCGLDKANFRVRDAGEIAAFRARNGLDRPYFIHVGSREQTHGYKNAVLMFKAMQNLPGVDADLLCVGGEPKVPSEWCEDLQPGTRVHHVHLTDDELCLAYAGAEALVFPSLYEGFGMPLTEAMASGCPVITTELGSLGEVAGDAALLISGKDVRELREAMRTVREPATRERLIAAGFRRVASFEWDVLARAVHAQLQHALEDGKTADSQAFHAEWRRVRLIQEAVDPLL